MTKITPKITKTDLVAALTTNSGMTKSQAAQAVDTVLDTMLEALSAGKSVGMNGLGTLTVKATAARTGVKPGTTEKIQIPAGRRVSFKPAAELKKAIKPS